MRRSPSIAYALPDDVDIYLVLDDFGGRLGRAWRETDEANTDRATMIEDRRPISRTGADRGVQHRGRLVEGRLERNR
jgi:hypothetical protein